MVYSEVEEHPVSYAREALYGTAPVTGYIVIQGHLQEHTPTLEEQKEYHYTIGGGVEADYASWGLHTVKVSLKYKVMQDFVTATAYSSMLGLALGSLNTTTGVITNRTTSALETITIVDGLDETTDMFMVYSGCMMTKYTLDWNEDSFLYGTAEFIGAKAVQQSTHPATTVPTAVTGLDPFASVGHTTVTITNPSITANILSLKVVIDTGGKVQHTISASRYGTYAYAGQQRVTGELRVVRENTTWVDKYLADPNAATNLGQFDLGIVSTKNSAAEYISIDLTDCIQTGSFSPKLTDKGEQIVDTWPFHAATISADVKS